MQVSAGMFATGSNDCQVLVYAVEVRPGGCAQQAHLATGGCNPPCVFPCAEVYAATAHDGLFQGDVPEDSRQHDCGGTGQWKSTGLQSNGKHFAQICLGAHRKQL